MDDKIGIFILCKILAIIFSILAVVYNPVIWWLAAIFYIVGFGAFFLILWHDHKG